MHVQWPIRHPDKQNTMPRNYKSQRLPHKHKGISKKGKRDGERFSVRDREIERDGLEGEAEAEVGGGDTAQDTSV